MDWRRLVVHYSKGNIPFVLHSHPFIEDAWGQRAGGVRLEVCEVDYPQAVQSSFCLARKAARARWSKKKG
jgi:hypothetical protein